MPLIDPHSLLVDFSPLRKSRDFSVIFYGRAVSLFGLGMLAVALNVQGYALTGSSLTLALLNGLLGLGTFAGTLWGGVAADRFDRRRLILVTRSLALLGFVALLINAMLASPSLWVLAVVAAWDGFFGACSAAALAAAVPRLMSDASYGAAGALLTLSADVGAIVAPLAAGVLIDEMSLAAVYTMVCVATALSIVLLGNLQPLPVERDGPGGAEVCAELDAEDCAAPEPGVRGFGRDVRECIEFVRRDRFVGIVVYLGCVQLCFASPHVLVPAFVATVFPDVSAAANGATVIGALFSAPAVGAVLGSIFSGFVSGVRRPERVLVGLFVVGSVGVVGFGLSRSIVVCLVFMALIGAVDAYSEIFRFMTISRRTPDVLRGRVSSLWLAQTVAGDVAGGPFLALLAKFLGPAGAIVAGGITATLLGVIAYLPRNRAALDLRVNVE